MDETLNLFRTKVPARLGLKRCLSASPIQSGDRDLHSLPRFGKERNTRARTAMTFANGFLCELRRGPQFFAQVVDESSQSAVTAIGSAQIKSRNAAGKMAPNPIKKPDQMRSRRIRENKCSKLTTANAHLFCTYAVQWWFIWNSYAPNRTFLPIVARSLAGFIRGDVMNTLRIRSDDFPYSAVSGVMLLLVAGFLAKFGVPAHLMHLVH